MGSEHWRVGWRMKRRKPNRRDLNPNGVLYMCPGAHGLTQAPPPTHTWNGHTIGMAMARAPQRATVRPGPRVESKTTKKVSRGAVRDPAQTPVPRHRRPGLGRHRRDRRPGPGRALAAVGTGRGRGRRWGRVPGPLTTDPSGWKGEPLAAKKLPFKRGKIGHFNIPYPPPLPLWRFCRNSWRSWGLQGLKKARGWLTTWTLPWERPWLGATVVAAAVAAAGTGSEVGSGAGPFLTA